MGLENAKLYLSLRFGDRQPYTVRDPGALPHTMPTLHGVGFDQGQETGRESHDFPGSPRTEMIWGRVYETSRDALHRDGPPVRGPSGGERRSRSSALTRKMVMHDNEHVQFSPSEQVCRGRSSRFCPGHPVSGPAKEGASRRVVLSGLILRSVQVRGRNCMGAQYMCMQNGFLRGKRRKQHTRESLNRGNHA